MNDPIQWQGAVLTWAPDGYRLKLKVWLDTRASALFEQSLPAVLERLDALGEDGPRYEFEPGERWDDERGAGAEPALLTIIAPRTLFAVEPDRLREDLGALAARARDEAEEQRRRDDDIAAHWLTRLRTPPTP